MNDNDLARLAAGYGVLLAERSVSGGYQWDGQTLGLLYQKWSADCECKHCRGTADDSVELCPAVLRVKPYDTIHDIAHFIVAEPWQRDLPEFGLGSPLDYGANGGAHRLPNDSPQMWAAADGLIPGPEASRQEVIANLIGYILMADAGVRPPKAWLKRWAEDYRGVERWAFESLPHYGFTAQQGWRALKSLKAIRRLEE